MVTEWYIFSEGERQNPAPAFRLPSSQGRRVERDDFRGLTNLILYFPHSLACAPCRAAVRGFAEHQMTYRTESARVLAILPAPIEALPAVQAEAGPGVILLADAGGRIRAEYAAFIGEDDDAADMLFVLDRHGVPLVAATGDQTADPAIHEQILDWLTYAEIRCPE